MHYIHGYRCGRLVGILFCTLLIGKLLESSAALQNCTIQKSKNTLNSSLIRTKSNGIESVDLDSTSDNSSTVGTVSQGETLAFKVQASFSRELINESFITSLTCTNCKFTSCNVSSDAKIGNIHGAPELVGVGNSSCNISILTNYTEALLAGKGNASHCNVSTDFTISISSSLQVVDYRNDVTGDAVLILSSAVLLKNGTTIVKSKEFKIKITSNSFASPVQYSFTGQPSVVDGGDPFNILLYLHNKDLIEGATHVQIVINITNDLIYWNTSCSHLSLNFSSIFKDGILTLIFPILEPNRNVSCSVSTSIQNFILSGIQRILSVKLTYNLSQASSPNDMEFIQLSNISFESKAVKGYLSTAPELSNLVAGQLVQLHTSIEIPEGVSNVDIKWRLPMAKRKKREIGVLHDVLTFDVRNFSITGSIFLKLNSLGKPLLIDNATVVLFLGMVENPPTVGKNSTNGFLQIAFFMRVNSNPILVSGKSIPVTLHLNDGDASIITLNVTGPLVRPELMIQKSAMVVDTSGLAHGVQVSIFVKHHANSTYDADNVSVVDSVTGMSISSTKTIPTQAGSSAVQGTVDKFEILFNNILLRVGDNITLIYTAHFSTGSQVSVTNSQAMITWKSRQVNSPIYGPIASSSVCLRRKNDIITKYDKYYWYIALGIFLGILFGALLTLAVLACCRQSSVARRYILEGYSPEEDVEKTLEKEVEAKDLVKKLKSENPSIGNSWRYAFLEDGLEQAQSVLSSDVAFEALRGLVVLGELKARTWAVYMERFTHHLHLKGEISMEFQKKVATDSGNLLKSISKERTALLEEIAVNEALAEKQSKVVEWISSVAINCFERGNQVLAEISQVAKLNTGVRKELQDSYRGFMKKLNRGFLHVKFRMILLLEAIHACQLLQLQVYGCRLQHLSKIAEWMLRKIKRDNDTLLRRRVITQDTVTFLAGLVEEAISEAEKEFLVNTFTILKEAETNKLPLIKEALNYEELLLMELPPETQARGGNSEAFVEEIWTAVSRHLASLASSFEQKSEGIVGMHTELMTNVILRITVSRDSILLSLLENTKVKVDEHFNELLEKEQEGDSLPAENSKIAMVSDEDSIYEGNTQAEGRADILESLDSIYTSMRNLANGRDAAVVKEMELTKVSLENYLRELRTKSSKYEEVQSSLALEGKITLVITLCSYPYLTVDAAEMVIRAWFKGLLKAFEGSYLQWKSGHHFATRKRAKVEEKREEEKSAMSHEMAINLSRTLEDFILFSTDEVGNAVDKAKEKLLKSAEQLLAHQEGSLEENLHEILCIAKNCYEETLTKALDLTQGINVTGECIRKILTLESSQAVTDDQLVKDRLLSFSKAIQLLNKPQKKGKETTEDYTKASLVSSLGDVMDKCGALFPYGQNPDSEKVVVNEDHLKKKLGEIQKEAENLAEMHQALNAILTENVQLLSELIKQGKLDGAIIHELVRDSVMYRSVDETKLMVNDIFGPSDGSKVTDMLRYVTTSNSLKPSTVLTPSEVTVRKRKGKGILSKRKNSVLPASYPELPPLRGTGKKGFNLKEAISWTEEERA